jgi:outer membrane biosynthesis protein TonB
MSVASPLPESPQPAATRSRAPRRSILSLVPSPIQARRAPFVALLLVLLAGGLVALLLLNTASAQDAFKLHALQSKEAALAQDMQISASKGDGLDDPAVLAARATALGMITGGIPIFLARGAPLPAGAIRIGNEAYIPGPVQVPVVPTPKATTPVAVVKPKTAVVPKTAVKPKTPVAKTPVAKTPVAKTPVAKTPVAKTPVAKTPVAKTPVAKAPTGATAGTTAGRTTGTTGTTTRTTTGGR